MPDQKGYQNRIGPVCSKIRSLLVSLTKEPSKYDQIAPKIEYWIEYVLREDFVTVDDLVEGVSLVAWGDGGDFANVGQFLREFRDAPHRSEQARSFVSRLCSYVLRRFAIASVEDLWAASTSGAIPIGGAPGFIRAASFVGYLIRCGLLAPESVRRHLIKPLVNHHNDYEHPHSAEAVRANALYQLLAAAGNTLLQGVLDPEDVETCFGIFDTRSGWIEGFDSAKVKGFREVHAAWIRQSEEEQPEETEECTRRAGENAVIAEVDSEVKTPVAPTPRGLPAAISVVIPCPTSQPNVESPSAFEDASSSANPFAVTSTGSISPTLSISTVSDFTSTELDEKTEPDERPKATPHDTFYFEDGDVEIMCGDIVFRVHSSVVSFSSPKLREVLSQPTRLDVPTQRRCRWVTISDSIEDFSTLLKMIYTPGFPRRHEVPQFTVFASLLRMTTKYGFSDVRDQLIGDINDAYPTKWKDFRSAKVLGEDIFGTPKPHPNAVLDLFEAQDVRFAVPFAAYRASISGLSALTSDDPGTVLQLRTLASTINGMHRLQHDFTSHAVSVAFCAEYTRVCSTNTCAFNVGITPVKQRVGAMEKIFKAMVVGREGGVLNAPPLGHLLCPKCTKCMELIHDTWASNVLEKLGPMFSLS